MPHPVRSSFPHQKTCAQPCPFSTPSYSAKAPAAWRPARVHDFLSISHLSATHYRGFEQAHPSQPNMVDRTNRPSALKATSAAGPEAQVEIVGSGPSSKVIATLPSGESVEVLLYGATVTSWKSNGGKTENLWLSEKAALDGSKAVRGGIPVVFPVISSTSYTRRLS